MKQSCMNCVHRNVLIDEYPCFKCTKENIKFEGKKESYNKILKQRNALYKACENLMEIYQKEIEFLISINNEKQNVHKEIVDSMNIDD